MGALISCLSPAKEATVNFSLPKDYIIIPKTTTTSSSSKYAAFKSLESDNCGSYIGKDLLSPRLKLKSSIILPSSISAHSGRHIMNSFGEAGSFTKSTAPNRERIATNDMLEILIRNPQFSLPRPEVIHSISSSYTPHPMTQIFSSLYIGTFDDACNESELKSKGITHILSLVGHKSSIKGVEYKLCPMDDNGKTDLKVVLEKVSEFMEMGQKVDNKLLVHCQSGQNRSAVVIISWLMMARNKTLCWAHKELKKLRPIIHINLQYAKKLLLLEQELCNGVNTLPSSWMEREYDESAGEVFFKYASLKTLSQL